VQLSTLWATIEGHVTSSPAYAVALETARVVQLAPAPPADTRVLVVDDEAGMREMLVEFLDHRGYQTSAAVDGASAVRALLQDPADIVLLDIAMPGLSGVDALPTIRAFAPRTAVIMVTANIDRELAKRCLAYGAFDFLVKPVNFAHLTTSLAMALEFNALGADSQREALGLARQE
jgi:two-component system response regulator (stage 0 sporulation protein F)